MGDTHLKTSCISHGNINFVGQLAENNEVYISGFQAFPKLVLQVQISIASPIENNI